MEFCDEVALPVASVVGGDAPRRHNADLRSLLERAYGVQFTILDGASGELIEAAPGQPSRDWSACAEVCRELVRRGKLQFIDDEDPFLTLALPLMESDGRQTVAVAMFLTRRVAEGEDLSRQADRLGMRPDHALNWARSQMPWAPESLSRISDLVLEDGWVRDRMLVLQKAADTLSINLIASSYEKLGLLCRMTQELKIAESVAIQLLPTPDVETPVLHAARGRAALLSRGECPITAAQFSELVAHLAPAKVREPIVVNRSITAQPDWPCPQVRQMVAVALAEGDNVFGWLLALNHIDDGEFGAVEVDLLTSLAAIFNIYRSNIELQRQPAGLLEGIVGALTSAIDTKDHYTYRHSDRVARLAACLARALGCHPKTVNTLYLAGELHDIGKISIDYRVLQKAGKLSTEEYDHIKQHAEIGHHILCDLASVEEVLPIILHHHEWWDGSGYPQKLDGNRIPLAARILAVADAIDAMSSDRPYRKRMPDYQIDHILHTGAGQQWDPLVIDAFFRVRDDIRRICGDDPPSVSFRRQ
jgi:putative nucleotidyltransferase with HDIG domain